MMLARQYDPRRRLPISGNHHHWWDVHRHPLHRTVNLETPPPPCLVVPVLLTLTWQSAPADCFDWYDVSYQSCSALCCVDDDDCTVRHWHFFLIPSSLPIRALLCAALLAGRPLHGRAKMIAKRLQLLTRSLYYTPHSIYSVN